MASPTLLFHGRPGALGSLLSTEIVIGMGLNSRSPHSVSEDLFADVTHDFSSGDVHASRGQKSLDSKEPTDDDGTK